MHEPGRLELKVASYNIRKAVGMDRRRDPVRILTIIDELGADIVALQEADMRFGNRASVLPKDLLKRHGWQAAPVAERPRSLGWHGNALLLREGIEVTGTCRVDLPNIEPRGAVRADLAIEGRKIRVVGMHLCLSGLRRREQLRTVIDHCARETDCPTVLMGDFNEWMPNKGALRAFGGQEWNVLAPGRSYPARRPLGRLDRIVVSRHWQVLGAGVHASELAAWGSDHLPVHASLRLPSLAAEN